VPAPVQQHNLSEAQCLVAGLGGGCTDGLVLEECEATSMNSCNRSNNSTRYGKSQNATENRFFETLSHFDRRSQDCLALQDHEQHTGEIDYNFCNVIGGPKEESKRILLNKCLCLCGIKWVCKQW
jgi:hypothetical protein